MARLGGRRRLPLLVALALLATAVAGCSGGKSEQGEGPIEGAIAGSLTGVVVDKAIRPIAQASVLLTSTTDSAIRNATTDREGGFTIPDLDTGSYFLSVSKVRYLDSLTNVFVSSASAGEVVNVVLADNSSFIDPYYQLQVHEGFIDCTFQVGLCSGLNSATGMNVSQDRSFWTMFLDPGPEYVQIEFTWDATVPTNQEIDFQATSGDDETGVADSAAYGCDGKWGAGVIGPSPLVMPVNGSQVGKDLVGGAGSCDIIFAAYSGSTVTCDPYCAGGIVQQPFTVYLTAFYGYRPPEGWRFIDGAGVPGPP